MKSRLVFIESRILGKSIDPKQYTPKHANHIGIALLLKDYSTLSEIDQKILDGFITKFWTSCECKYQCFEKVWLEDVKRFMTRR